MSGRVTFLPNIFERGTYEVQSLHRIRIYGNLLFLGGRMTAKNTASLSQKTQENLSTAMHGEAFAYAKYLLYARHARQNGECRIGEPIHEGREDGTLSALC